MNVPEMRMTDAGNRLHTRALTGEQLRFTRLAMGDGKLAAEGQIDGLKGLIREVVSVPITKRRRNGVNVTMTGPVEMPSNVTEFRWRELGVFACIEGEPEVLYCYWYNYEDGEIVKPDDGTERTITVTVTVGNAPNVVVVLSPLVVDAIGVHTVRSRVRDPAKPTYGLEGGEEDDDQATLRVSAYTGGAEVSAEVNGILYDADNMSADGATAPNGTLIIKKLEEQKNG